jgi:uncharacterized protein (DUF1501 family)
MTSRELLSRRSFLRNAAGFSLGISATNALFDLRLLNNAVAATNVSDYKALVCLFLNGGNDGSNMLIPFDPDRYNNYRSIRGARLALWRDAAEAAARADAATNPNAYYGIPLTGVADSGYAVHNAMTGVQSLYNQNKLAFLPGVGTMVEPITRAQYRAGTRKKPPQLFSHNDQVTEWMTSVPDQISRTGWGGRTVDKIKEELVHQGIPSGSISMSVSMAGSNTWEVGDIVNQFQVGTSGAVSFTNYSGTRKVLMDKILRDPGAAGGDALLEAERTNLTLKDFRAINERALLNGASLSTALARLATGGTDVTTGNAINTAFGIPTAVASYSALSSLEQQLHTIARIISQRSFLGMRRQIFFCSIGGFDTHGDQPVAHNNLMNSVSRAMSRFYAATQAIGIPEKVTTFSISDFGRTFKSNGLGTDHAWSNHHMIMGGAVNGGRVYGTFPNQTLGGPDDTDSGSGATGRFLPTTSTDEYAATLARWFGLGEPELDLVFPNLNRFANRNLGFMA